jgi:aminoglycoside phosphotransferase (APT) family kinase protein
MEACPWEATHSLTDEIVSLLIGEQFPHLAPVLVTARYEGCDNLAFEVNDEWIFRFPKRADGELPLKREIALLSRVSAAVVTPVPEYRFIGKPGPVFPYMFAGYPKLKGTPAIELPLSLREVMPLARSMGSILSSVHSFSTSDAHELGVAQAESDLQSNAIEALAELAEIASVLKSELVDRCVAYLKATVGPSTPASRASCLLHGDFSAEHILLSSDGQNIVGVIDWTDTEIGDPAFDFGYLWVWHGEPFVREVLHHYQGAIDPGFIDRACAYGICSAVADCYYGMKAGIERNRRIGVAALERSFSSSA